MQHHRKVDQNQKDIVFALRQVGATVRSLASLGEGIPDLLVGYRGKNYLMEVKNRDGKGVHLTIDEQKFFDEWKGRADIVACVQDALQVIGL